MAVIKNAREEAIGALQMLFIFAKILGNFTMSWGWVFSPLLMILNCLIWDWIFKKIGIENSTEEEQDDEI